MKYQTALIAQPNGTDDIRYPNGNTKDIIETVLYADSKAARYTKNFAPTLKGATVYQSCRNIWQFLKSEIQYDLDPEGKQLVKSPGRLWDMNKRGLLKYHGGDCKSFSVFIASCLRNLNIPYGYRFVSYNSSTIPTHVYVFVPLKNDKEIIVDAVWDGGFNTQKYFSFKDDRIRIQGAAIGSVNINNNTKPSGFLQY